MAFRTAVSSPMHVKASPGSRPRPVSRGLPVTVYRGRRLGHCKDATGYRFGPAALGLTQSATALHPSRGWSRTNQRPQSSPAGGRVARDRHDIKLPNVALAEEEEEEFDDTPLNATGATIRPTSASAISNRGGDTPSDRSGDNRVVRRKGSFLDLDLSLATQNAAVGGGIAGESFIANFRQISLEGTKARGRMLATRQQLEKVKQRPADDGRFAADVEQTKAEVGSMLNTLVAELESMQVIEMECQEIRAEVDDLLDNDARMGALLAKMNRKLDVFQATVGNF